MRDGGPAGADLVRRVRARCRAVLEAGWREGVRDGVPYSYTAPSPGRYPWQWYWDSCLTAIAQRHLDPARSRAELESLLAAAEPDGFIGHTIFWGSPVSLQRLPFYNVQKRSDRMTRTIQPPLLAWAWKIAVGDPAKEPAIVRHHAEIERRRDLEGDGLLWIIQPDESGLDAAPEFDAVWGRHAHGRFGFRRLIVRNRKLGFDARAIAAAGEPVVCEPLTNTLHGMSRLALGQPSITPALIKRLWDPQAKLFRLQAKPDLKRKPAVGWAALAPLALPDLPEEIGRAIVERHLLNPKEFWSEVAPPSVSLDDPSFTLEDKRFGLRRYWRGPTWVNSAWLVWMGLKRLGYETQAQEMARGIAEAVDREGLREYYDPHTGRGMGAQDFAWSTLIMDMLANDPRARTSYIDIPKAPTAPLAAAVGR
jgi:hypothetical protein